MPYRELGGLRALAAETKGFTFEAGRGIGQGVLRSTNQMQTMTKVVVVLKKVVAQNRVYFVLTSYRSRVPPHGKLSGDRNPDERLVPCRARAG